MAVTDEDIMLMADQLAKELDLDDEGRNAVVLRVQRLVWPPSPYATFHVIPNITIEIAESGTSGTLSCPHGCGRRWRVNQAPDRNAVWDALKAAHREYATGKINSEAVREPVPGGGRRMDLGLILGRSVPIEVTDEKI